MTNTKLTQAPSTYIKFSNPFLQKELLEEEVKIKEYFKGQFQMDLPYKHFKTSEIQKTRTVEINIKKAPGFDILIGKVLEELSEKYYKLTIIYNGASL